MSTFQDAKDTFYLTLRDRLAALNPDRTVVVRGNTRPGMLVQENELARTVATPADVFVLRWTGYDVDPSEAMPLERARCEILYGSRGLPEVAGMDRGRTLQAMDEELRTVFAPQYAQRTSYAGATADVPQSGATRVFWSDATPGDVSATADRLERVVTVDVFAWKEEL